VFVIYPNSSILVPILDASVPICETMMSEKANLAESGDIIWECVTHGKIMTIVDAHVVRITKVRELPFDMVCNARSKEL
jgi:hypothetical protein